MPARILYVEDDPDIQIIARMALEKIGGFIVKICSSGGEAIKVAEEFSPDLVLLDVMMPDMDGPQTMRELRGKPSLAGVPMLFVTAKTQRSELELFREMGVAGVISKPFDPMELASTIRQYLSTGEGGD
ncbi:MAG: response regulator [Deltaproteobacteria bacterium]|nr:response regulator [Deltaproteobacteria bacterium]